MGRFGTYSAIYQRVNFMSNLIEPQRLLGFDYGEKRIGVAVGQVITQHARPLTVVPVQAGEPDWSAIDKIVHTWQPDAVVVGLPTNMDGRDTFLTDACKHFANNLKARYQLDFFLVDERLSTVEARARLFEQGGYRRLKQYPLDAMAACVILEHWLHNRS